jgi:hypothetical protein
VALTIVLIGLSYRDDVGAKLGWCVWVTLAAVICSL